MHRSNLRLVYSKSSGINYSARSQKSTTSLATSWSISDITKKLTKLNALKPAHVGAVNHLVDKLLQIHDRPGRHYRNQSMSLLRGADPRGSDGLQTLREESEAEAVDW